jgi:hypothetical protein
MAAQNFASSALVGVGIGLFLLQKLINKGVLSADDVSDIADGALLKMEEWQSGFPEENREDFEEARQLLESVLRDARNRHR